MSTPTLANWNPNRRPRVLVLADWYAPGFRAGGPIRSLVNFADRFEQALDIHVLTTDRDLGQAGAYPGVPADRWLARSHHQVYYASPGGLRGGRLAEIVRAVQPDHIYLNSMYSRRLAVQPLLLHRAGLLRAPLVLAPRGMLAEPAMAGKPLRKRAFLATLRVLGVPSRIRFQATDEREAADIRRWFGHGAKVVTAGNVPSRQAPLSLPPRKEPGALKVAFVGRSHPIKNLDFLLRVLCGVRARVELTLVLATDDEAYALQCRALAEALPAHVAVRELRDLAPEAVKQVLRESHLLALPSRGENFGHAILEALAAGRPVLVSDRTPWRNLAAARAGWDLPLDDEAAFRDTLETIAAMDHETLVPWCSGAWEKARAYLQHSGLDQAYAELFP
jgi:glycosyltransferase involved in cell wall biosynthesis